jgi:ABC-2 type transport system ATP-binding protein
MVATALSVTNLSKVFYPGWLSRRPPSVAVNNISFDVQEGEILGFLGPNGAGKTTTIQMLLGVMTPSAGTITYFGKDFAQHRSEILQKVTFASAYARLPSRLTIEENLDIYGRLYGLSFQERKERIKRLLTLFGLWHKRDALTGPLSAGQMTRVMLAKAFLPNPKMVLLDEPTASLDPDIADEVRQFILQQRREQKMAILFTSHNMAEIEWLCDRVLILQRGRIVANNTPEEIARQISKTHVQLMICSNIDIMHEFLAKHGYDYSVSEHNFVEIEIDDHQVAQLLLDLARVGVDYSQISIEKPTLEDYFLQIAKASR